MNSKLVSFHAVFIACALATPHLDAAPRPNIVLIIADSRQKTSGQGCPRVVEFLGIFPTLVELCDVPKPDWLEGESLVPPRDWFIGRSIRTERWRYTEWDEGRRGNALFDHDNDPHEMRNLAADPAHKHTDGTFRPGVALPILSARLKIGSFDETRAVTVDAKQVTFTLNLPAGRTQLQTWFSDKEGSEVCGAYYLYVTRR